MPKSQALTTIRAVQENDVASLANIYNHYVATSVVTFEEEPVTDTELAQRITDVHSASLPWLVAEQDSCIAAYAYATPWRTRKAYRFSVEITAYVSPQCAGRGLGSKLYDQILPLLRTQSVHAVMAVIALPNQASVALHEKFGFRKVAHLEEVGFKFDRWIDVGYWQRLV